MKKLNNKYSLTGDEYTQLEKDAQALLIDYGFVKFPIDVFALAKQAYKADIVKYSSLPRKKLAKIKDYETLNDGFTVFHKMSDGTKRYTIYYNDKCNVYRQRYTIGHELKHIFYDEETPKSKDEDGAEYFSKVLLAPKCLVIKKKIVTPEEMVEHFGLSLDASRNHLNGIYNRIRAFCDDLFAYEKDFIDDIEKIKKVNNKK